MKFQLSYYAKQRIIKRLIDVVMVVFLLITLFPIFWMVYCSFKDNTDILTGKIMMSRASNDVLAVIKKGNNYYIGSADGKISVLDRDRKLVKSSSIRSSATSFTFDEKYIWVASSNKGLSMIRWDNLKRSASFKYPVKGLDVNKIASSVIYKEGDKIWIGLESKNFDEILEFDAKENRFTSPIDIKSELSPFQVLTIAKLGNRLLVGGDKGIISVDLDFRKIAKVFPLEFGGITTKVWKILPQDGKLYLGTSSGLIDFNLSSGSAVKRFSTKNGLASDQVGRINKYDSTIYLGTNQGLTILDAKTGKARNYSNIFQHVNREPGKALVSGDVLSILKDGNLLILGSTSGRTTYFDLNKEIPVGWGKLKSGHIVIRWRNYVDMWYNIDFGLYLRNSLIICGISMIIAMIFATMAAYAFSRFRFPGSDLFGNLILATQMIPAIMYLIPLYIMFVKFNELTGIPLKGTFPGIILIYSAFFIPFSIWILRGFFAAIPKELEEAARIDGCSQLQVFWHIVLPLAIPGIIATGVYVFLTAWDELMFAWVLCNADTMTIPVGIRLFVGNYQNRFDLMMAAATVATIPVMVLFFMLQKYIIKGLTAGAVKG